MPSSTYVALLLYSVQCTSYIFEHASFLKMLYQCGPPTARICIVISKNNKVGTPYPSSVYIPPQYKQHSYPACRGLPWLVSTMDCQAAPTMDCQAAPTMDCQAASTMDCQAASTMDCQAAPTMECQAAPTMDCQADPTMDCQAASTRDCQATLIVH